ncbi:MAG: winged helix-turn-helix domain-containing protein [Algicola sp.]|nr:winged helix-turn-helix domain-containing protein [Algicola sp.]
MDNSNKKVNSMTSTNSSRFALSTSSGQWKIDSSDRSITSNGKTVNLPPKPMDLLVFLARHQGEVVSYQNIINAVWDGRVSGNQSIINAVKTIRDTLNVTKCDETFLTTIAKKGYN